MAALKKGLQRREYFNWILKDVVTHSNNIVECLFYVGSMAGAGCEEGGKRPTLCVDTEARSWHWWLPWAVIWVAGGSVGLRCQWRGKPSSAQSSADQLSRGAQIQSPASSGRRPAEACGGRRLPPPLLGGSSGFPCTQSNSGRKREGERKPVSQCALRLMSLYQN